LAHDDTASPGPQPSRSKPGPPPATHDPTLTGIPLVVATAACLLSVFLDQTTSNATSVILPYMTGSVHASVDEGRWLVSAYLMPYFVVLLVSPYLIGRFGRHRVWMIGHAVFAAACFGCALSSDAFGSLVFWRFVQGLAQGTFFVCAVSTVLTIFPQKIQFLGFAIFAGTSLSGAASAPAIGGYFSDTNQWTMLYVVLGLGAIVAAAAVRATPETAPVVPRKPFDGLGIVFAFAASLAFTFLIQYGEQDDWLASPTIDAVLATLLLFGLAFVAWERFLAKAPFLDLRIFGYHNLLWGSILGSILGVPLFGSTTTTEYLQSSLGFSASLAGGEVAIRIVTIVLIVPFVAFALAKKLVDLRYIIIVGFVLVATSYVLQYFGTTTSASFGTFVLSILCSGAGFAMLFSPVASSILTTLPQALFTRGVALFKFTLVAGGTFATAALQIVVDHRTQLHATDLGSALQPGVPTFETLVLNSHLGNAAVAAFAPLLAKQATTLAYADSFLYTAILVVVIAPLTFVLKPPPK
jgi:DHA2 family multidrug resistance protein